MKSCREKFDREQEQLPPNLRKNADKIIAAYEANNKALQAGGNYDLEAMNNQAFDTFNKEALVRIIYYIIY